MAGPLLTNEPGSNQSTEESKSSASGGRLCFLAFGIIAAVAGLVYYGRKLFLSKELLEKPLEDISDGKIVLTQTPTILKEKPQGDSRSYQYFMLPNGLTVINVHDNQTTQAAFSVSVDAGSLDNPKEFPGLAHFCEHMIFLGTGKYPDPTGFDTFMAKTGGFNNAYTAQESTVYYAEVSKSAAKEALDRMADFFRDPLFSRKYVEKEIHAIDSEHSKNIQDQGRRIFELFNHISNPENPSSWFMTGNKETLISGPKARGLDAVDALKTWNKKHYCASKLRLVTYSSMPLTEQGALSKELFKTVPEGSAECRGQRRSWSTPERWPAERMQKFLVLEGNKPIPELWVHFPLPDVRPYYKNSPLEYMDYFLSYGGEHSLQYTLKDTLGYVSSFQTSGDGGSYGFDYFLVFELTPKGRKHYSDILDLMFAYMAKMQHARFDDALLASLQDLSHLKWNWSEQQEGSKLVMGLAATALNRPPQDVLADSLTNVDAERSALYMSKLRPDNVNVAMVDPNASRTLFPGKTVQTFKEYHVNFTVTNLEDELPEAHKRWSSWFLDGEQGVAAGSKWSDNILLSSKIEEASGAPVLPTAIQDIPKQLKTDHMHASISTKSNVLTAGLVKSQSLYGDAPNRMALSLTENAKEKSGMKPQLWYRGGWVTVSPKVQISMRLMKPRSESSFEVPALDVMRMRIYNRIFNEEIQPKLFDMTQTGVAFSMALTPHSITFGVAGFEPSLPHLMDKVLDEFDKGINITDASRYDRIVQKESLALKTFSDNPIAYALADRNALVSQSSYSVEEQLAALKGLQPASVAASVQDMLLEPRPLALQGLAMGNLDQSSATAAFDKLGQRAHTWKGASQTVAEDEKIRNNAPVVKPSSPIEIRRLNRRPGDTNDATVVSFMLGVRTVETRVIYNILTSILHDAAYSELRTSRQLGYIVSAGITPMSNVDYVSIVVQGDNLKADKVEGAIEYVYTVSMPAMLENMTADDFKSHTTAFMQKLLSPPTKFSDEFAFFWGPVQEEKDECLGLQEEMLAYLQSSVTSKDVLIDAWNKIAYPKDGRKKLTVKHFADEVPTRPTLDEAKAIWKEQGVPDAAFARLEKEYTATKVYDKADSSTRGEIAKAGGYYPTEVICKRSMNTTSLAQTDQRVRRFRRRDGALCADGICES